MSQSIPEKKDLIYTKTTDIEHLNMKTHQHEFHHQLTYMIKGTLRIKVAETEYFLPEGFIGMIPARMVHSLRTSNEKVKMYLIYFPSHVPFDDFISINSNDFIIENIRFISKQSHVLDPHSQQNTFQFVDAFLTLLLQTERHNFFSIKGLIAPKNERLHVVLEHLRHHYQTDITLTSVADKFGFTTRNLTRLFKKENLSFNNYLNYVRIIRAIELFADHKDNIENVAYAVGYNSASNFSRTFKKYTGHAPSEFIKYNTTKAILR